MYELNFFEESDRIFGLFVIVFLIFTIEKCAIFIKIKISYSKLKSIGEIFLLNFVQVFQLISIFILKMRKFVTLILLNSRIK